MEEATVEGAETITDIQNYLASFNKEIQITDGATTTTTSTQGEGSSEQTSGTTFLLAAAPASGSAEGFQYESSDQFSGATYYTTSDGTYFTTAAGADGTQATTITAFAAGSDTGQRTAFRASDLQQIVLAVGEPGSGGAAVVPTVLTPTTITAASQVGDQPAFVTLPATSSQSDENQSGQSQIVVTADDSSGGENKSGLQTIRMVLRQPDGTETEQSARIPTLLTSDGQEISLSDENQLQVISSIVEQAASSGLADGTNQVILNVGNAYQAVTVVPTNGAGGEVSYMFIVAQSEDDKDAGKEDLDLDMSVYDFNEGERHGEIVSEEVGPDGTKTRTIRITQKKNQIVTQAHMCNYCNYTSPKRYLLSRHMKSHSEERPHKCGVCERGFKTLASLQNHVNTHTGTRPHCCRDCDSSFTTSGELVRHVRYRHTHEKPHKCTECDYASVELSKLKRHMRCHTGERPYQCPHCTYASPDMYKLKRHLRIHTGEKPYECDICQARFTQSNSLKAHKLIHSGNKPAFHCDFCPTTCGRKTDLRIHMQKLHTSDKPLKCKRCGKTFPDRYSYKLHAKTHEGEKCFKCDLCPYASISQRHLESHMLIHTDQKPFRCDECDQAFRQKQLLRRHKNLYHDPNYVAPLPKEKTNECSECGKAFRHKGNLIRHLAIHDPDATMAEKEEALRIGEPKGPGEQPDGEEDDEYYVPDGDDDMDGPFPGGVTISEEGTVQETEDGQQVVVFEVIQLTSAQDEQESVLPGDQLVDSVTNSESVSLAALQDVTEEDCFASAVAEAIGEAPPLPVALASTVVTPAKRGRGRPKRLNPNVINEEAELVRQIKEEQIKAIKEEKEREKEKEKERESQKKIKRKVNEVQETVTIDNTEESPSKKRPVRTCRLRKDDAAVVDGGTAEDFARHEAEQERKRQEQKKKDMAECFGFNEDEEETETILAMQTVPGSQPIGDISNHAS